ncbi:replicative DNA helicase [Allobaculum sp. JKK-2023]|uniref:replicative DNA helicase n=1 Tax=Allobaculum sp. JKK-2023 TaxID=3108943 RepID=UPI002B05B450|nr:replicative DNA helicase [Allobaculum sp. JKK-2023]
MIRELPNAQRMEQSLLGAILVYPEVLALCRDADLSASEFFVPAHQKIYEALLEVTDNGQLPDFEKLIQRLTENQDLEATGGLEYLSSLMDAAVTQVAASTYIETIQNKSQLRKLIDAADKIADEAGTSTAEIDAILDDSERMLMDVTRRRKGTDFKSSRDLVTEIRHELEMIRNNQGVNGIATGYSDLDRMTNGFHRGDLIILAARPAMGKSALALNFANQVARRNEGAVAIFSLEMPGTSLVKRLLAAEGHIDSKKLTTGKLDPDDQNSLNIACNSLSERKLFIDDTSMIKVSQIFSKCRKLRNQEGSLSLIVIDYLQLISGSGRGDSRQQEVSEISRNLKILAKEMDCPVIALSQLSRKVEERTNHEPQLSDLRESGSIEQDADIVMFIYREQYYNSNPDEDNATEVVDLSLKKHRNGETGKVELVFEKACSLFSSMAAGNGLNAYAG